jgi:hypothetical protein
MKKSVGILFVFLFFVSSVCAVCISDQTIVSLYRINNSHVSTFDDANYQVKVCYSDLFGYNYTGSNPHTCDLTNSNIVFWINSTRNSHISEENSSEYSIPICYGNLRCSFKPSCDSGTEVLLLKASDIENAHVSFNQPEYVNSICCKNSLSISSSFWSDLNGDEIANARLGDTVLMVARGFEFENKQLNFTVMNTNSGTKWYTGVVSWMNELFRKWQSSDKWVQISTNEWIASEAGKFKFLVNIVGTNATASSFADLTVDPQEINTLPFVNITSGRVTNTLVRTNVSFNATVYDKNDFLTVIWEYGDGAKDSKDHYSLATEDKQYLSAIHSFANAGHYVVKLTAREENPQRNQASSDSVDVYVYSEGINVIPVVSSPIDGKNDYGSLIRFDASKSFVANCSTTDFRNGEDLKINGTELNCKYIHAPGKTTTDANYNLDVEWTIDGVKMPKSAWGTDVSTGTIQNFLRYFSKSDRHVAQLSLVYTPK